MNIYDIARIANVSIATVSRVVNNSPKVSPQTKERVLAVIEEAGYTPNIFAQGLGLNTMHTVGILVPRISDVYMSVAVSHLEELLHKNGYDCILGCSGYSEAQKAAHTQLLLSKHIDALILVGSTYAGTGSVKETNYIREASSQTPVFIINGQVAGDRIFCTSTNDYQASFDVTTCMIENGRSRILVVNDSSSYSARQKMAGYEQALKKAGLPMNDDLIIMVKNDIRAVENALRARTPDYDAVFATNDLLAIGALKYTERRGLSVPADVDIVGFNNSPLCIYPIKELTSVDNHIEQVCKDTVSRLIAVLSGKDDVPRHSIVACSLVKRDTTSF